MPVVGDRVAEEYPAPVAGLAADLPLAPGGAALGRGAGPVGVQRRAVIPQPADLHPAAAVDLHQVHRQQLVIQLRGRDLQREPALGHRGGEQRVRAVPGARIPRRGVLAELAVLPDLHDPGRDQVLGLRQGEHRVGLGIGAPVSDIDPAPARQHLQQQRLDPGKCPLDRLLISRPQHPGGEDVGADDALHLDQVVILIDRSVISGDGLGGKERQPGDLVPGEGGDQGRRDARVRPFHVLAPVRAQRQRHHHIAQQHRHVDGGVRYQGEPEGDQRMGVEVQAEGERGGHRLAEHVLADLDPERAGIQRDDLPGPVDHHMLAGERQLRRRPGVTLPGAAGTEPFDPHRPQGLIAGNRHLRAEPVPDVLADQPFPGLHRDPRPVQAFGMHCVDGLAELPGHRVMPAASPQPVPVDASGDPEPAALAGPPDQGPFADAGQAQNHGRISAQAGHLGDLGQPPLVQRGGRRIVARPWFTGQGVPRAAAAVAGLCLHQVGVAHRHQLPLPAGEVLQPGRLAAPAARRARGGGRGGPAVAVVDQRPDSGGQLVPVVAAQQHPACVRLELLHLPLGAGQHQPAAHGQLHRPARCAAHRPPLVAPRQTRALSPNGPARSMARARCQIR